MAVHTAAVLSWSKCENLSGLLKSLLPNLNHSESKSHVSKEQKTVLRKAAKVLKLFSFYLKPEHLSLMHKRYVYKKEKKKATSINDIFTVLFLMFWNTLLKLILKKKKYKSIVTFERKGKIILQTITNADVPMWGPLCLCTLWWPICYSAALKCKYKKYGLAVPVSIC